MFNIFDQSHDPVLLRKKGWQCFGAVIILQMLFLSAYYFCFVP